MANESKNPIFWSVMAFIVGIVLAVWGHLKSESDNYSGSTTMIVIGLIFFIAGVVGMFTFGNRKR
jgi:uncharacterized membrane protein HdeD (DUF308 family)